MYTWILDNGHGHNTPGKRSPKWKDGTQLFEYEFNRNIVNYMIPLLEWEGIDFVNLVPEKHDVSLRERVNRANEIHRKRGNSILISVHGNAAEWFYVNKERTIKYNRRKHGYIPTSKLYRKSYIQAHPAKGFSVFTTKGVTDSDKIATYFVEELEKMFCPPHTFRKEFSDGDSDWEANFYIIRNTKMPAILTENGFFTNEWECKEMMTEDFQIKCAHAHVEAIKRIEKVSI